MTFKEVHAWCRANRAEARGIHRGKEFFIRPSEEPLPANVPLLDEVFHWDLQVGDQHYPTSPSDMKRLVTGKMSLEEFKGTRRD